MEGTTIVAAATAMSKSGINKIRISGPEAVSIADRIFVPKGASKKTLSESQTYTLHYGLIKYKNETVDEVIVLLMKGPKSYTREDVVEIDCHGGIIVTKKIIEIVISEGAVPAEPGEFTKRAFLNGRIDLSKAEAVMDIINAKSEYALKSSVSHLQGKVFERVKKLREEIITQVARIEAALDDPEHLNIEDNDPELNICIENAASQIEDLLLASEKGVRIKEGINTAIIGKPNAGKSSLLNFLTGNEKAIVTDVPGTTRDIIEESISIDDINLNLTDTAGIRNTKDIVEKIGVDRAMEAAKNADLILYLIDSSSCFDEEDKRILSEMKEKNIIILLNKSDLKGSVSEKEVKLFSGKDVLAFSTVSGEGYRELASLIKRMFYMENIDFNEEVFISNIRQINELKSARDSMEMARQSFEMSMSADFLSIDLMGCYDALGRMIGEKTDDDLADMIFSKFCMGK